MSEEEVSFDRTSEDSGAADGDTDAADADHDPDIDDESPGVDDTSALDEDSTPGDDETTASDGDTTATDDADADTSATDDADADPTASDDGADETAAEAVNAETTDVDVDPTEGDDTAVDDGDATDDGPDIPTDEEGKVEPVEVLVNLAEEGEIDPWDIDIVAVTDAFLAELDAADLRASGRALFYASVLLRMKSDAMLGGNEPADPEPEPWEMAMDGEMPPPEADDGFDPVAELEAEMDRRLERKSTRGTPETLDELVRDLRDAERGSWWKKSRSYDTSESPRGFSRGAQTLDYHAGDDFRRDQEPTEEDVTGTTHNEEIDEVIADVAEALAERYDRGRDEVLFAEIRDAGGKPVMTYLALLFLSNRGDARLDQDHLFGDLWVQDPDAVDTDEPAGAGVVTADESDPDRAEESAMDLLAQSEDLTAEDFAEDPATEESPAED